MPLLTPPPPQAPVSGDKHRLVVLALAVVLAFAAVAAWTIIRPDSYGISRAGCVSVTIPSSTGGALLHECGTRARATCSNAFRHHDRLSLLLRPPCRSAGLR